MPVDVIATLRRALRLLEREKTKLESRIVAIRVALDGVRGTKVRDGEQARRGRRSGMSAAARKAVSQRMKAYWARRRADSAKRRAKASSKGKAGAGNGRKRGG